MLVLLLSNFLFFLSTSKSAFMFKKDPPTPPPLPHSFYFEMSLIPLRLNLHDAIIFRTTNGEKER